MNWYIIILKLSFNVQAQLLVNGIFHNRVHPNRSSHSLGFFLVWEDQRSRGLRFCGDCGVCWVSTFSRMLCGCHNCSSPILDKKKNAVKQKGEINFEVGRGEVLSTRIQAHVLFFSTCDIRTVAESIRLENMHKFQWLLSCCKAIVAKFLPFLFPEQRLTQLWPLT